MAREVIVAGLDLGTNAIKCVVGVYREDETLDIIGVGNSTTHGVKNGTVCNRDEVIQSIRKAVDEASMMGGCDIRVVHTAISSRHFQSFPSLGIARIRGRQVTQRDVQSAIDLACAVKISPEMEITHVIPTTYCIDGETSLQDPIGVPGVRLEIDTQVIIANREAIKSFVDCCKGAHLKVADIYLPPLAQAEALLTPREREVCVALCDIGSDTTDLSVFHEGALIASSFHPFGGNDVTLDIKDCLRVPYSEAESLKLRHGATLQSLGMDDITLELAPVGGQAPSQIKRHLLCEIIDARLVEMLSDLSDAFYAQQLPSDLDGGIILTGGTANLEGMAGLAQQIFKMPAAVGGLHGVSGLIDVIKNPRYTTATGLVLCGARRRSEAWFSRAIKPKRTFGIF